MPFDLDSYLALGDDSSPEFVRLPADALLFLVDGRLCLPLCLLDAAGRILLHRCDQFFVCHLPPPLPGAACRLSVHAALSCSCVLLLSDHEDDHRRYHETEDHEGLWYGEENDHRPH